MRSIQRRTLRRESASKPAQTSPSAIRSPHDLTPGRPSSARAHPSTATVGDEANLARSLGDVDRDDVEDQRERRGRTEHHHHADQHVDEDSPARGLPPLTCSAVATIASESWPEGETKWGHQTSAIRVTPSQHFEGTSAGRDRQGDEASPAVPSCDRRRCRNLDLWAVSACPIQDP